MTTVLLRYRGLHASMARMVPAGYLLAALAAGALILSDDAASQDKQLQRKGDYSAAAAKNIEADYGKYEFTFKTLEGREIRLSDYAGRVVLVNIWAPWCGPCKREIPGFAKLYEKYKRQGFEILGVAVQTNETAVRDFMEDYEMKWPVGLEPEVAARYGTYGLPDNYLFGPDGSVIRHFVGYTREEVLEPLIRSGLEMIHEKSK